MVASVSNLEIDIGIISRKIFLKQAVSDLFNLINFSQSGVGHDKLE